LPMYRDCPRMDLSTAESLARRIINLPSSARLARVPAPR
jgi:perosamine synthetase